MPLHRHAELNTQWQPERDLVFKFNAERTRFYTNLKTFSMFGKGWMRRVADNLVYAAMDLGEA